MFDIVEAGLEDLNNDGVFDSLTDTNGDGFADDAPRVWTFLFYRDLVDSDNDGIPDLEDSAAGGDVTNTTQPVVEARTVGDVSDKSAIDPILPLLILLSTI